MKRYLLLLIPVLYSFGSNAQSGYKYHTDDSLLYVWSRALFRDPLLSDQQKGKVWGDSVASVCKSRNVGDWNSFEFNHNDSSFIYIDTAFMLNEREKRTRHCN